MLAGLPRLLHVPGVAEGWFAEFPLQVVTEIGATQRWRGGGADVYGEAAVRGGAASLSRGGKDAAQRGALPDLDATAGHRQT